MKRKARIVVALMMSVFMTLGVFAGCGDNNAQQTTTEAAGGEGFEAVLDSNANLSGGGTTEATTTTAATTTAAATTAAATTTAATTAAATTAAATTAATTAAATTAPAEFTGFPPREQMLICEPDGGQNVVPGQFNPYMVGTPASWGMHQIAWADGLWETNTMTGETIPTVAESLAVPNADFTEWTIKIREGLKWSDGTPLNANDVYFTFMMIMTDERLTDNPFYTSVFSGAELIDDYNLKIFCKNPFPRIMTTLGVNTWGCGFRVVPEHVFKDVDVTSFLWTDMISADAYVIKEFDPLGYWILYEKRADWADTPTGRVWGEPIPPYILYRLHGSQEARVMAMINNEIDVMNDVPIDDFRIMSSQNNLVRGWYKEFPFASTDDACGKGIMFNMGVEPFNNVDVRWALTLACDYIEVTKNIFDGIGRMSALAIPAVMMQEINYFRPMSEWLTNEFTITGDYNPWNPNFALELAPALQEEFGYNLSGMSDQQLIDVFGSGYWKTDRDKAASLLEGAGFSLQNGRWNLPDGTPWVVGVLVHPEDNSSHVYRTALAIADQWEKFGITTDITILHGGDISTRTNLGEFETVSNWPWCSNYRMDVYNNISGWNFDVYNYPLGEVANGISAYRLPQADPEMAARITEVIKRLEVLDPNGPEIQPTTIEFLKLAVEACSGIQVHSGIKLVPVNETYWTGYPTAENPYEGPWWWWSLFRGIVTKISPVK